jgi:hypothetical protein
MALITKLIIHFLIENFKQMETLNKDIISHSLVKSLVKMMIKRISNMYLILGAIKHKKAQFNLILDNQVFVRFLQIIQESTAVVLI